MVPILALIQAITGAPTAASPACAPGVYLAGGDQPIPEIAIERRKIVNLGGAVFLAPFAAGKLKIKSVIPGAAARVQVTESQPSFRMCFAVQARDGEYIGVADGAIGVADGAATAADYRLVRLLPAGDHRELELAAVGGFGGGGSSLAKAVMPVDIVTSHDGSALVRPRSALPPGEYGFIRIAGDRLASTRKRDVTERIVDFAVVPD